MRRQNVGLALLLMGTTFLQACATAGLAPSVLGRDVTLVTRANGPRIKGELLAVDENRVIVGTNDGIHEVAIPQIAQVRVRRHSLDGRQAWTWMLVGALVTGVGLAAACASVDDANGCGGVGAAAVAPWIIFGGLSARSLERSAFLSFDAGQGDQLRAFARFPQGLPLEFDLRGKVKPPSATKR
jgi:hypothetical protein